MNIKNIILDILFPKFCVGCGKEGKYICDKCKVFISEAEPMIYTGECLDGLISVWDYEGLIKELIHMIKYQGVIDIIKELVGAIQESPEIERVIHKLPLQITYVPMYIKKEKKRGFNQAEIIARELAKKSETRSLSLLEKVVDIEDQAKLSKEERLENVKDCFRVVGAGLSSPEGEETSPLQNVLLVDDVFTSGATMKECCKVLKKAGVKKVWGFTLARTV